MGRNYMIQVVRSVQLFTALLLVVLHNNQAERKGSMWAVTVPWFKTDVTLFVCKGHINEPSSVTSLVSMGNHAPVVTVLVILHY